MANQSHSKSNCETTTGQTALGQYGSLKPITPEEAIQEYLGSRELAVIENTLEEYDRKLEFFKTYCEENGLQNLNNLGGREIDGFEKWRRKESSDDVDVLATKTVRDDLYLLRDFISYLEKIEGVPEGTSSKVEIPDLEYEEEVRNVELSVKHLEEIVSYLRKFNYATREHVVFALFKACGRRLGGIHSLDLSDVNLEGPNPYLEFRHHDDGRTRLKNGVDGEEEVNIGSELAELLREYIENARISKTVEGRKPLITTSHGRVAKSTIRSYFYRWSRPCEIGKKCPEDRDPESCTAAKSKDEASKCPASEAPHAARHGYITDMRRQGVSKELLSDRCDVSEEVLEKHYDERTTDEKREARRSVLEEAGVMN